MIDSRSKFEQELSLFLQEQFPDIPHTDKEFIRNNNLDLFCAYLTV